MALSNGSDGWVTLPHPVLDAASREDNLRTAAFVRESAYELPTANQRRIAEEAAAWFEARAATQTPQP